MRLEKTSEKMNNIIFAGTPAFAVPTLQLLCKTRKPVLCITQPDKTKGRNRKMQPSEVKISALEYQIPVFQPENINSEKSIELIKSYNPDIIITVAYGGFLNKTVRTIPMYGCINLHPSLLPKYRGSAPINYALFHGDKITGCTIFRLTTKMDAGPILCQSVSEIYENECFTELAERLSVQGAKDVINTIEIIENGDVTARKQEHSQATYSHKFKKNDLLLEWDIDAVTLRNKVRGLAFKPGLTASFRGKRIKLLQVEISNVQSGLACGTVVSVEKNKGIVIAAQDFDVLITKLQPTGKAIMDSYAFHLGAQVQPGEIFTNGF